MFLPAFLLLAAAVPAADESAVLATVQRLFDAMAARDGAAARAVLLPEAPVISVRAGKVTSATSSDFVARVAAAKEPLREGIREPRILIHRDVAHLWAPYMFHRGDTFSHCGIDSFSLVKTPEGWRIAGLVYTIESAGCDAIKAMRE
jgi:hypothetical protein